MRIVLAGEFERLVAALAVPLVAFAVQWLGWDLFRPYVWFLFFPAVFCSSRIGGVRGGLLATLLSAAIVTYFFIPPQFAWTKELPVHLLSVGVFIGMGVLFSLSHEQLRRANLRAEDALRATSAANVELAEANRQVTRLLEASRELDTLKSQFFANVSHELRTPLTLILGPLERRLHSAGLSTEERLQLELMARNARLLQRHVADLLDVARLEAGRIKLHYSREDLAGLIRMGAAHFESLAVEQGVALQIEAPEVLWAEVDAEKFRRVFINLLSNAFKFTPQDGRIKVQLERLEERVVLRVADTGPGIPESMREAVFERFRQVEGDAERRHGGTGLGLAIVREFVELHGGQVTALSAADGGALLEVSLPVAAPETCAVSPAAMAPDDAVAVQAREELSPPATPPASVAHELSPGGLVLVVDDNADMQTFLRSILEPTYAVATASDGENGLALIRSLQPDLVVCDIMMPVMNGERMVETLRADSAYDDMPVVMLTAKASDELRLRLLGRHVQAYLLKPFEPGELLARVAGLLSGRRKHLGRLRGEEMRYDATFEHAAVGIAQVGLDGRWLRVNQWLCDIVGYTREEMLAMRFQDITHPDDLAEDVELLGRVLAGECTSYEKEKRYIAKVGITIWIRLTVALVRDLGGQPSYFVTVIQDISRARIAEEALRATERTYRSLFDNMLNSVVHARVLFEGDRPVDMEYIAVNPAFAVITGITAPVVGRRISEVLPGYCENNPESLEIFGRVAATGEPTRWQHYLHQLERWFAFMIYAPAPGEVVIVTENITEQQRAIQELEDSRRMLGAIVDGTSDAVYIKDREGRYVLMNRAGAAMCGRAVEDVVGHIDLDFFPLEQARAIMATDQDIMTTGEGRSFEERIMFGDGLLHVMLTVKGVMTDSAGAASGVFGISRDITELKRTADALVHKDALLRAMLRNLPFDFWARDPAQHIIMQSDVSVGLWGDMQDQTLETSAQDAETIEKWGCNNRRVLAGETVAEECSLVTPHGERRLYHNIVAPIRDGADTLGLLGVNIDITDLRRDQDALLRAKEQAEAASRAKSTFLANMSHEIRTPLNGVLGMLQLLQLEELSAEQMHFVEIAERAGRRLTSLLSDILDLSRIEAGRMPITAAPFSIAAVCEDLEETFSALRLEKGLDFHVRQYDRIPSTLSGDALRLRQILCNLVGNAMKFTAAGFVQLDIMPLLPPPGGGIRLLFIVTDTGIGIPDTKLDLICAPFTQVDENFTRSFQGAGLGLAIARQLVLTMGGTLTFDSVEGEGTSVYLTLPFGTGDALPVQDGYATVDGSVSLRVLLVEDEEVNRFSIRSMLERHGHRVDTAGNGLEALEKLSAGCFDCVLMDIQMEGMDGLETVRLVRSGSVPGVDARMPIVAMTAYAMHGDKERFLAAGMDGYVSKPVEFALLAAVMREVVSGRK